jgi:N-methylhydantoinase A
VRDWSRTVRWPAPPPEALRGAFAPLESAARADAARERLARAMLERRVDVRYAGQSYEVSVPFGPAWAAAFHRAHRTLFGHADVARPVEVVTLRVRMRARPAALPPEPRRRRGHGRPLGRGAVVFEGRPLPAAVHRRDDLGLRAVAGPAIVCEYSATTVVPPGWRARVDRTGGLLLERRRG